MSAVWRIPAVSYTHLDVYKRQAQERSKKSVTGRLKEIACAEIDEQTENLVASLGDTQVDYRFFLGFKLVVTDKDCLLYTSELLIAALISALRAVFGT